MSICRGCGADVPETQNFCHTCGEPILAEDDPAYEEDVSAEIALDRTLTTGAPEMADAAAAALAEATTPKKKRTLNICSRCHTELPPDEVYCVACGHTQGPEPEQRDPLIGVTLADNFVIEEVLGEGAMGRVYRARQLSLDKKIAIKVLHQHLAGDRQIARRFHREARAASRLNHPNSLHIIDFGQTEDNTLYIAMEFLEGKDLHDILREDFPLELERIVDLLGQVCLALDEAHAAGIVHRDLKPENIMVIRRRDGQEQVKVCDFGIAKIQDPGDSDTSAPITMAGIVCGTPEYMAPEQCRGEPLDGRADVYSAGVILYQLVTNALPFVADSPLGVVTRQLTDEPTPPSLIVDTPLVRSLEPVILKALLKDRDARYGSALELKRDLERVLAGEQIPLPRAQHLTATPHAKQRRRKPAGQGLRWLAVIGASLFAGLAAFLAVWYLTANQGDGAAPLAPTEASPLRALPTPEGSPDASALAGSKAPPPLAAPAPDAGAPASTAGNAPTAGNRPTAGDADATPLARRPASAGRRHDAPAKSSRPSPEPPEPDAPEKAPQKSAYQLGRDAYLAGNCVKAIPHFERAARANPGNAEVYRMLGKCYFRESRTAQGRAAYRRYLQLRPNAPDRVFIEGALGN